jgi:release factor glutamine methyltransferase
MRDTQTVAQVLTWAEAELVALHLQSPRLDAEVLLAHSLSLNRAGLYARLHSILSLSQITTFQQLIHRRLQHEPGQYITGIQEFWSLDFTVNPDVLIPRPETELVVETALRLISQASSLKSQVSSLKSQVSSLKSQVSSLPSPIRNPQSAIRILDVGTGSGCIAIALATELPTAEIWATDISAGALAVAEANAHRHNVHHRIRFLHGSVFAPLADQPQGFDVMVSNPPYIARDDLLTLQPEVRDWEPRHALDGGNDGLDFYRQLLNEAPKYLTPNGWLVLEIGHGQEVVLMPMIQGHTEFADNCCVSDYEGRGRIIAARKR